MGKNNKSGNQHYVFTLMRNKNSTNKPTKEEKTCDIDERKGIIKCRRHKPILYTIYRKCMSVKRDFIQRINATKTCDALKSRAAVGMAFQSPYPSHTHRNPHGNPHTHGTRSKYSITCRPTITHRQILAVC